MTPKEAIECLKNEKLCILIADKNECTRECSKCGLIMETDTLLTAYDMAIKTLGKQIPKKVSFEDVGYDTYHNVNIYACKCPSCELEIIRFTDDDISDSCNSDDPKEMFHSSMVHHGYIGLNNYCNRCGQKLNWSEEE